MDNFFYYIGVLTSGSAIIYLAYVYYKKSKTRSERDKEIEERNLKILINKHPRLSAILDDFFRKQDYGLKSIEIEMAAIEAIKMEKSMGLKNNRTYFEDLYFHGYDNVKYLEKVVRSELEVLSNDTEQKKEIDAIVRKDLRYSRKRKALTKYFKARQDKNIALYGDWVESITKEYKMKKETLTEQVIKNRFAQTFDSEYLDDEFSHLTNRTYGILRRSEKEYFFCIPDEAAIETHVSFFMLSHLKYVPVS